MSKYDPLKHHLALSRESRLEFSFRDLEEILGFDLPNSARRHAAWWSNSGGTHVQSAAWLDAGYRTEEVDIASQRVRFFRDRTEGFAEMGQKKSKPRTKSPPSAQKTFDESSKPHPIFGIWKGKVTLLPGYDYTQPADPDWGKVYDD
jgi:hypothetical protein